MKTTLFILFLLILMAAGLHYNIEYLFAVPFMVFVFTIITIRYNFKWNKWRKKVMAERGKADICTFARTFNCREVDTKLIREVYNRMQEWLDFGDKEPFPVRADDRFYKDYEMDGFDLEDMYYEISEKFVKCTENPYNNPYYNKVDTVHDLVMFIHHQPKLINT